MYKNNNKWVNIDILREMKKLQAYRIAICWGNEWGKIPHKYLDNDNEKKQVSIPPPWEESVVKFWPRRSPD